MMPMNEMMLLPTLRRIRACEGEVAAQLALELFVAQNVAKEREACAKVCEALPEQIYKTRLYYQDCAKAIRARKD